MAFESKAIRDRDVAAGALMVKIAERRATLLGLNPPIGHEVAVVHVLLNRIAGKPKTDEPEDPEAPLPH